MDSTNLQQNLYWYLLRVAISSKHVLMEIGDKYDLTVMQFYALCVLGNDHSVPMNSLSKMLFCDASNVTGIVDRLFARDLIKREENPKDRRVKMITLTPAGAEVCKKIFEDLPNATSPASGVDKLSADKREQLAVLLKEVLQD
jgi:DNA-binding MarR family transcriptional regulator